jgi:y4mF family transcriptional regulator
MVTISSSDQLAELIRRIRKQQQLTQEQLAAAAGVGRRFIVDLEAGKPSCEIGKTLHVLTTLGLNLAITDRAGTL